MVSKLFFNKFILIQQKTQKHIHKEWNSTTEIDKLVLQAW